MASKNTMEVRGLMKASKLFDLRDNLLLDILNSKICSEDSMQLLQQINLDALASSPKFRDSKAIETLIASIIESNEQNVGLRKGIFDIFQKQICKCAENVKYITKNIEDPVFLSLLMGKDKESSYEKLEIHLKEKIVEIKQNLKKVLAVANEKKDNIFQLQKRAADERSNKRNKKQYEIAKERTAIQASITEYEVIFYNITNRI